MHPEREPHERFLFKNSEQESRIEIARKNLHDTTNIGQQLAGDMFLELAFEQGINTDQALANLEIAGNCWDKSILLSKYIDSHYLSSCVRLSNLSMYRSFLTNEMADLEQIEKAYYDTVETANLAHEYLLQSQDKLSSNNVVLGILSETLVLSLLQRFNISSGNPQWTILPSLISQDLGKNSNHNAVKNSWDLSVFTHYDETELSYKIQVKTAYNNDTYENDIQVVRLSEVCKSQPIVNKTKGVPRLLYREMYGDSSVTEKLDVITENLLDVID